MLFEGIVLFSYFTGNYLVSYFRLNDPYIKYKFKEMDIINQCRYFGASESLPDVMTRRRGIGV